MRFRISLLTSMLSIAAFMAACDMMESSTPSQSLSPAEMAARAQATADSATKYKDSLTAARRADSIALATLKTKWKTDSGLVISAAKTALDKRKADSGKAVKKFKDDSLKARSQFVKDSSAWAKDSIAGVKVWQKDSGAFVKKMTADSLAYEKAVANMAKKYTKDSTAVEAVTAKFLAILAKDSAAITAAQAKVETDTAAKKAAAAAKALEKANAKLVADQAKMDAAVAKAVAKVTSDSTKSEEAKAKVLTKRAEDSTKLVTKYTTDSTKAAGKVTTRLATWAASVTKDSTKLAADTAAFNLVIRNAIAAKITKDSTDSLKRRADSITIASADSSFLVRKAVPSFSVAGGTYGTTQSLVLTTLYPTSANDTGKIYYTLDGTTPDSTKTRYTAAISLTIGKTVKAIAYKKNYAGTKVFGQVYVIDTAKKVTFTGTTDTTTGDSAKIIFNTSDTSVLYYTINGAAPTTATTTKLTPTGTKDSIKVGSTAIVKVLAVKTGRTNSPVVTDTFYLQMPKAKLGVKADTVLFNGSFKVAIKDTVTTTSILRYTTTGTAPTSATNGTGVTAHGDTATITATANMTIKSTAFRTGSLNSLIDSAKLYVKCIAPDTARATDSVITLSTTVTGGTIRYELGASPSTPTVSSTAYTTPITVPTGSKLWIIVTKTGLENSSVVKLDH